jgi:hypothetical protein
VVAFKNTDFPSKVVSSILMVIVRRENEIIGSPVTATPVSSPVVTSS